MDEHFQTSELEINRKKEGDEWVEGEKE